MNELNPMTWEQLPDSLLINIFNFLEELDLVHASSTCTRWRRMFYEPRFWRSVTFDLNRSFQSPLDVEMKLQNYLQAIGSCVRHVTIICPESGFFVQRQVTDWVKVILNTLTDNNRTLQSFKIEKLKMVCQWRNSDYTNCDLIVSLCDFIESQNCLQTLDLSEALLPTTFGHMVMSSLARSPSVDNLMQLDIFLLYASYTMRWRSKRHGKFIRSVFAKLKKLKEIRLNYSLLEVIKVDQLCTTLQHPLEQLKLKTDRVNEERFLYWEGDSDYFDNVDGEEDELAEDHENYVRDELSEDQVREIARHSWAQAIQACPGLKVSMDAHIIYDNRDKLKLQSIPVSHFTIRGIRSIFGDDRDDININIFLSESLINTLETLTLIGDNYLYEQGLMRQANPADIARKLKRFPKLRSVQIAAGLMSFALLEMVNAELRAGSGIDRDFLRLF